MLFNSLLDMPATGGWSADTIRFLQPRVNILECLRLHKTAKASPSVDEYLDSVLWVKGDPTYINF